MRVQQMTLQLLLAAAMFGVVVSAPTWGPVMPLQGVFFGSYILSGAASCWVLMSLIILGKLLRHLYQHYWLLEKFDFGQWDIERVLWVWCAIACLIPLIPWAVVPIWNLPQLLNFIFIYETILQFGALALLSTCLIKWLKLKKSGTHWSWRKYATFDRFAYMLLPIAILSIMSLPYSTYTLLSWVVGILLVTPLQSMAEELLTRGVWLRLLLPNANHSMLRVISVALFTGVCFGLIHLPQFGHILWQGSGLLGIFLATQSLFCNITPRHLLRGAVICFGMSTVLAISSFATLSWPMVWGCLVGQGIFGVMMAFVAYITDGIEVSSFFHALNNSFFFITSFGVAFAPLHVVAPVSWALVATELFICTPMLILTIGVYYWRGWNQTSEKETTPLGQVNTASSPSKLLGKGPGQVPGAVVTSQSLQQLLPVTVPLVAPSEVSDDAIKGENNCTVLEFG